MHDPQASVPFEAYIEARAAALHRFCVALTGSATDADDLLQEALVRCYPRWERIRVMGDVDAYVRKVITTRHVSLWRSRRLTGWARLDGSAPGEHLFARSPGPDDGGRALDAVADRRLLVPALLRLPARQRAVVVLTYFEDLPDPRIAQVLGCRVNTVKSHRAKALDNLRRLLPSDPSPHPLPADLADRVMNSPPHP